MARRTLLIGTVIAALGVPAAAPGSFGDATARSSDRRSAETVRILAYNIHHGEGMDDHVDLVRIAAFINELSPDLVALQEVDRGAGRTGGVDQAAMLGELTGMSAVFGEFMPYQGGQYGMALLSRWPVIETTNHRLPDGLEPRSALAARVRSPASSRELIFAGIHLYRSDEERLAQASRIVELLGDSALPVVLAGDFNSTPDSEVMRLLSRSWRIVDKGTDRLTWSSTKPEMEIDYVLLPPSGALRSLDHRVLDEAVISDHRPLWIELSWDDQ